MYKLLSLFAMLAAAFAAPAPEPGPEPGALIAPIAYNSYKAPLTYIPSLGYAALPQAPIAYTAPLAYSAYPAPIAYSKLY